MKDSAIEWTDHTFNPWIGCTKVSPGCLHCYAETLMDKRWGRVEWGAGNPRQRTSEANWKAPLHWNAESRKSGVRQRVFCASLADWLDDEVPIEWLVNLLETVHATPHLDWLLLTKRPENWQERVTAAFQFAIDHGDEDHKRQMEFTDWLGGWLHVHQAPSNVWIGTTVEDQPRADERIPLLLAIPARIRFLSCEPLLGPVDLKFTNGLVHGEDAADRRVDWVICGGESGPGARPMHPAWGRSLRDQCGTAGVAFFFKQWGDWALHQPTVSGDLGGDLRSGKVINVRPYESDEARMPGCVYMQRAGKHAAGRTLDGNLHNAFPTSEPSATSATSVV